MDLRDQLRRAREKAGLSQTAVAEAIGVTQSIVSKWERGSEPMPSLATIERWAEAVGVRLSIRVEAESDPVDVLRGLLTVGQVEAVVRLLDVKKVS